MQVSLSDIVTAVTDLFNGLNLFPVVLAGAVIALAGSLYRRLRR